MSAVDNSEIVASFIDTEDADDPDLFWCTELLDRRIQKGNNRFRLLRTFEHHSREDFLAKMPIIRDLCERNGVRAYIRLSPRSHRAVAQETIKSALDLIFNGQAHAVRGAYGSACGRVAVHHRRVWFYDVDDMSERDTVREYLEKGGWFRAEVPSKSGVHLVCTPHHWQLKGLKSDVQKDNPTNLYIPDGAE